MRRLDAIADAGEQLERTSLAWIRTALALAASAVLMGRAAVTAAEPALGAVLAAVIAAMGVTAGVSAVRSYDRRHVAMHEGRLVVFAAPLLGVAVTLTLASVASLGIVLT